MCVQLKDLMDAVVKVDSLCFTAKEPV